MEEGRPPGGTRRWDRPPSSRLENFAKQMSSGASPVGAAHPPPQGTNPWGTGASFPAIGSAPFIPPWKPSAEGGARPLTQPAKEERGHSLASHPKSGVGATEYDTFHGPTLAAGGVLRPKSEAVGIKHKWRAYSAGAPDACPSTRHMAGPNDR